jgi:hypothetical protein
MNNTIEQLIDAGWQKTIAEYFLRYAKTSKLLSKVDLRLINEPGNLEQLKVIRYSGVIGSDTEHEVFRRLVANVVDQLDAYILEYYLEHLPIKDNLIEPCGQTLLDYVLENYKYILNVNTPMTYEQLRPDGFTEEEKEGIKEESFLAVPFLETKYKTFEGSLFMRKGCEVIGKLEVYIGESLNYKPELWSRQVEGLAQVGIGVKVGSGVSGIGAIVGKYRNSNALI